MRRNLLSLICLWLISGCTGPDNTGNMNPFLGTSGTGHTSPCATVPGGMIQAGPQTGNFEWEYTAGYQYADTTVYGFSQTRLNGTGVPDLGDLLMLPCNAGADVVSEFPCNVSDILDKDTETALPGYYSVILKKSGIRAEMTASAHVAFHRYTYPGKDDLFLFVNPLISILPRLVFAFLAALIYKAMSKINDKFSVPFTAFVSSLIHTVLVLGILYIILFFAPMPENVEIAGEIQGTGESFLGRIHSLYISTLVNSGGTAALPLTVIGLSILSNGIPEAVLAAIIVSLVTFAYRGIEGKTRKSLLAEIEEKKEN